MEKVVTVNQFLVTRGNRILKRSGIPDEIDQREESDNEQIMEPDEQVVGEHS